MHQRAVARVATADTAVPLSRLTAELQERLRCRAANPPAPAPEPAAVVEARAERMRRDLARRGVPEKFLRRYDVDLGRDPPLMPRRAAASEARRRLPAGLLAVIDSLKSLETDPRIVALLGERGRGKTAVCAGLCRWFYERGRPAVAYATAGDFQAVLLGQMLNRDDTARYQRRLREAKLLIVDEVQQQGDAQFKVDRLSELVDDRWRNERPTVLVSNLTIDPFRRFIGDQIWRRMLDDGLDVQEATWPPLGPLLGDSDWPAGGGE